jgi:hypothetical protein
MAVLDGAVEDLGPMVMHIDPVTFAVTADKSILCSVWYYGYHNFAYEGTGTYNSCDGSYEMRLSPSVDEGSWPAYLFSFTKND